MSKRVLLQKQKEHFKKWELKLDLAIQEDDIVSFPGAFGQFYNKEEGKVSGKILSSIISAAKEDKFKAFDYIWKKGKLSLDQKIAIFNEYCGEDSKVQKFNKHVYNLYQCEFIKPDLIINFSPDLFKTIFSAMIKFGGNEKEELASGLFALTEKCFDDVNKEVIDFLWNEMGEESRSEYFSKQESKKVVKQKDLLEQEESNFKKYISGKFALKDIKEFVAKDHFAAPVLDNKEDIENEWEDVSNDIPSKSPSPKGDQKQQLISSEVGDFVQVDI